MEVSSESSEHYHSNASSPSSVSDNISASPPSPKRRRRRDGAADSPTFFGPITRHTPPPPPSLASPPHGYDDHDDDDGGASSPGVFSSLVTDTDAAGGGGGGGIRHPSMSSRANAFSIEALMARRDDDVAKTSSPSVSSSDVVTDDSGVADVDEDAEDVGDGNSDITMVTRNAAAVYPSPGKICFNLTVSLINVINCLYYSGTGV